MLAGGPDSLRRACWSHPTSKGVGQATQVCCLRLVTEIGLLVFDWECHRH